MVSISLNFSHHKTCSFSNRERELELDDQVFLHKYITYNVTGDISDDARSVESLNSFSLVVVVTVLNS